MNGDEFEAGQRAREWFHGLTVPPGMWTILRVDGRSFTALTEGLEKPFDERFSNNMVGTAQQLMVALNAVYAYTESDEISVVLPPAFDLFNRSVEKLVSVSAGIASSTFSVLGIANPGGLVGHFDSRVWVGAGIGDVVDYMSWRQADAARCCLNGWLYWQLRNGAAMSAASTTTYMKGMKAPDKQEELFKLGVNFNDLPLWQRRGVGLWWEVYNREGWNPKAGQAVVTQRRRVHVERELEKGDVYRAGVRTILDAPVE